MKTPITQKDLEKLSQLELELYAGNLRAFKGEDIKKRAILLNLPVKVEVTAGRGICDDTLYEICLKLRGKHKTFSDLRIKATDYCLQYFRYKIEWNLLSVLFDGIYAGEPEDLLNYRRGEGEIFYPIKGLGRKIADILYLIPN